MKTILVLTDLSENALRAAETAAMLSGTLKANILLLNSNYTVPAIPYYPGAVLLTEDISWEEECKKKLSQLARHVRKIVTQFNDGQHMPKVRTLLKDGDLAQNVKDIVKTKNVEIILMGGRSGGKVDHILFGSATTEIVDHTSCPVLIVSPENPLRRLSRIVFASNFNKEDKQAIDYMMKLGKIFNFQLEIVHVNLYNDHHTPTNPLIASFIKTLAENNYPNVIYRDIRGKDLIQRLVHFCKEREADVLAFTHQHHSYFAGILKQGTVKESLAKLKLPLLIFPSEMKSKADQVEKKSLTGYIL